MLNDICDFIHANKLEEVELLDCDDFTFSVFLDEEECDEIEYTFNPFNWEETIKRLIWFTDEDGEKDDIEEEEIISREEALKLRNLL